MTSSRKFGNRTNDHHRKRLFQELSVFHHHQQQGLSHSGISASSFHDPLVQTRSIWSYLFPKDEEEKVSSDKKFDSQNNNNKIVMPARRQSNQHQQPTRTTAPEKEEMEVQRIIGEPIGSIDDITWSSIEDLIDRLLALDKISSAYWLLDRLSKEPTSRKKLTKDMVHSVVNHWYKEYVHRRKTNVKVWEAAGGGNGNRIHGPAAVWKKLCSYESEGVKLSSLTYHRIIDATLYSGVKNPDNPNGPALADTVLQKMIDSMMNQNKRAHLNPIRRTFNATIASWESAAMNWGGIRSDKYDKAATRSLELLRQLKSLYQESWDHDYMPNRESYLKVMRLYAHQGNGDLVEQLMEEMYSMYLDHDKHEALLPSTEFFSIVLFAWSRSREPGAAKRGLEILDRMLELEAEQELPGLEVAARSYNVVLVSFAWLATKKAADQMQSLFDRMVELSKTDPNKKPTASSYASLVTGWSNVDPARAEEVIATWRKQAELGNCKIKIDSKIYGTLIAGWYNSKSSDCPERCEKLLQDAIESGSDIAVSSFDMTINAWCRKKSIDAAYRAEALLRQMQEYEDDDQNKLDVKPTIYTYAPIIFCYANLNQAARAEALLREFFDRYPEKERGMTSSTRRTRLDTRIVNGVLKSWLSRATKDSEAVERSVQLLLDLRSMHVNPNIPSFDLVLKSKESQKNSPLGSQAMNARTEQVIALLDEEYKNGTLRCKLEDYLTKRQAWILFNA